MSFNLDDPLAGILSDGSDDSFFDDDILGKKKPSKKKSTPIAEKKSALFDLGDGDAGKSKVSEEKKDSLFNLGVSVSETKKTEDKASTQDLTKSPAPVKRTVSKESISINPEPPIKSKFDKPDFPRSPAKSKLNTSTEKIDKLGGLLSESRKDVLKPLERGKSSQSLLDDILGGPSVKPGGSFQTTRPTTAAKSQDFDLDSILGKSESKSGLMSKSLKQIEKNDKTFESTGALPLKKKSSDDWLGIFGEQGDIAQEEDAGMPSWLVGDKKKKHDSAKEDTAQPEKEVVKKATEEETTKVERNLDNKDMNYNYSNPQMPLFAPNFSVPASNDDLTTEGAAMYLQQQESQLMVALQLKAQEEKLAALQVRQKEQQRVQKEATQAQQSQLDAMLRRQADQRQQMQSIIASHQERITQRIKALLGTPATEDSEEVDNINKQDGDIGQSKKESPHMKEKKQLLQLVQSLQENHDKEIDLMETSYRRQLAFLEISLNQSEERMKEESEKLVKFYTEKIMWLEEHHLLFKKLTEENMNSMTERHKAENEMLRLQHLENIKVLQEHHASLIENIKNAVNQEHNLLRDSAGFSTDLKTLVADVKESRSQCEKLVEKVQRITENNHRDNERSVQMREEQINDMIQQLKKEREQFDNEKIESREIVRMLETRLKQMTTMVEEETAALKQKKMEFEFEKATFSKQTEFAKNVLKKQEEEIKMIREDIEKEYKDKISKIDEDRVKAIKDSAAIAKEKASIQSLKQEIEKTKAELQGQLEEVIEERTKLNLEKQQMHMEEQRILAKSRDLDLLAKTAIEKQSQSDKKYAEAEYIQKKYEERIRKIQEHVVSLNAREKQIAREKVALSRERLMLHNEKKQLENRQPCSLCRTQNVPYAFDFSYQNASPVSRDYGCNMSTAMNAVESEMAHFMGRNFNLRHTTGIGKVQEHFDDDKSVDDDHSQSKTHETTFKDYMDPKFMMLRLDVQQVISNLEQNKKEEVDEDIPKEDEPK